MNQDKEIRYSDPVLCFVSGNQAYFTTRPLDKQWGDDWNDAPYEHNAGGPYCWRETDKHVDPWEIVELFFVGPFETPDAEVVNSRWSIEDINAKMTPWLATSRYASKGAPRVAIFAGVTLTEFKQLVKSAGGRIWVEEK